MTRRAEDILEKFQREEKDKNNDKNSKKNDPVSKWKKDRGYDPEDYNSLHDQVSSEIEEAYWYKKAYQTKLMEANHFERRK